MTGRPIPRPRLLGGLSILISLFSAFVASIAFAEDRFACKDPVTEISKFQIMGGHDANPTQWPFIVGLYGHRFEDGQRPFCAGVLIAPQWVVTAAHCEADVAIPEGVQRIDVNGKLSSAKVGVVARFRHPAFHEDKKSGVIFADLLLLKLARPMATATTELAFLATSKTEEAWANPGTCATVAGWGRTDKLHPTDRLQAVEVPIVSHAQCSAWYDNRYPISADSHICAGYEAGVQDACFGDSGGPLVVRAGPTPFLLVGIVSFGDDCASPKSPGIYVRVSTFRDWIFSTIAKN